jgi:hypothetical protein
MEDIKVKLTDGEVILRKPTAGTRNGALIKAETPEGFKRTIMMVELLPACISMHPWGMKKIKDQLNNLSIQEYDLLIDALEKLMGGEDDLKKKLNVESDQKETEKDGSSE